MMPRNKIFILSNYRALDFLKGTYGDKVEEYITLPDYSFQHTVFTAKSVSVNRFMMYLPLYLKEFADEHIKFQKISSEHNFDLIITDTRFGIYSSRTPSYLLCHHIKIPLSGFLKSSEMITEFAFYAFRSKFKKLLIPDFEEDSLAGEYTHNFKYLRKEDIEYLGILSMIEKAKVKEDIDYFFSVSGPEPQRTVFEKIVLDEVKSLKDKKIVIGLGKPEKRTVKKVGNVIIYGFLDKDAQTEMMNRSKLIITRSGYTTLMDLAQLGKRALLIPTKGQPEQEYLAEYHLKQGNFYCKQLEHLNLSKDLEIASRFPGFKARHKTEESVRKFMELIEHETRS
jgi:hypothetical protein